MDVKARIGLLIQAQGAHRAASEIDTVARSTKRVGDETATTGRRMREADRHRARFHQGLMGLAGAARFGVAALGGVGLVGVLRDSVAEYRDAAKVGRATNAAIKATGGVANVSAKELAGYSTSLGAKVGIDNDAIQSAGNLLLGFRAVHDEVGRGNDIYKQALRTAVDMSAYYKTDLKSSVIQLGKALNDPVAGATALKRTGAIDAAAIVRVKEMAKHGADLRTLQRFVLEKVQKGGALAAATANTDPLQKLGVAWKDLEETIGRAFVPTLSKAAGGLATFIGQIRSGRGAGGAFRSVLTGLFGVVKAGAGPLITAGKWVVHLVRDFVAGKPAAVALVTVLAALVAGFVALRVITRVIALFKAARIAMIGLFWAMKANPIMLVISLLVAVGAALVVAYHKVAWFRVAVQAVWGAIKGGFNAIVGFVASLPGRIAHAASGMWNGLKAGLAAAVNFVIDRLNNVINAYNDSVGALAGAVGIDVKVGTISHVAQGGGGRKPDVSGFPSNVFGGSVPGMAAGGIVRRSGMAFVGEYGPELLGLPAGARVAPLPERMDTTGGGMRLHPDDIRALAAAIAENPPEVHLDGRHLAENGRRHARRDAATRG